MKNFFINLYKPAGITSFDCIRKLRKIFNIRKIGHMGTLDPFAQGVLLLGFNKYTSFFNFFNQFSKKYRGYSVIGKSTDTGDLTGNVIIEKNICAKDFNNDIFINDLKEEIKNNFSGEILQIPPMASAIKMNGKKLYELHRKGCEIKRSPRKKYIYEFLLVEVIEKDDDLIFVFDVECSSGTYIRTLIGDLFKKFDIPSHLINLVRSSVYNISVEKSCKFSQLEECGNNCKLFPEDIFNIKSFKIKPEFNGKLVNGNVINVDEIENFERDDEAFFYSGIDINGEISGYYKLKCRDMHVMVKI